MGRGFVPLESVRTADQRGETESTHVLAWLLDLISGVGFVQMIHKLSTEIGGPWCARQRL
jgi:hypothetical protein